MKKFTSKTQKVGEIGEKIAEVFLVKHGFIILERNFTCKAGEIDIICQKSGKIHFVEVKAGRGRKVSYETLPEDSRKPYHVPYNPFQNVTREKLAKCVRTIELWLSFHKKLVSRETYWQMDGISVSIDSDSRKAQVEYLENINI